MAVATARGSCWVAALVEIHGKQRSRDAGLTGTFNRDLASRICICRSHANEDYERSAPAPLPVKSRRGHKQDEEAAVMQSDCHRVNAGQTHMPGFVSAICFESSPESELLHISTINFCIFSRAFTSFRFPVSTHQLSFQRPRL